MTLNDYYDMIDLAMEYRRLTDQLMGRSIYSKDIALSERASAIEQVFITKYQITRILEFLKGYETARQMEILKHRRQVGV